MTILFYLFATLIVISSFCIVFSRNPVYSVLWLIFAFCNASGLMILLGAEFIAMMLIVIYVGAIAVLFLFVIMMLDISWTNILVHFKKHLPLSIIIAIIMFVDLSFIITLATKQINLSNAKVLAAHTNISNTHQIGMLLYTDYILQFQAAGIILFVAMIACISLTIQDRSAAKTQDITKQNAKNKDNAILITKPELGQGVEGIKYD